MTTLAQPRADGRTKPSNSSRRACLCAQHQSLRRTIAVARSAASDSLTGGTAHERLMPAVVALAGELLLHVAAEEEMLGPILAGLDAWGAVRLERLGGEPAQEGGVLGALAYNLAAQDLGEVARGALALCEELLADMEVEEGELF